MNDCNYLQFVRSHTHAHTSCLHLPCVLISHSQIPHGNHFDWILFLLHEKEGTHRHELHSFAIKYSFAVRKNRMHIKPMSTVSFQFIFILKIIYRNSTVAGAFSVSIFVYAAKWLVNRIICMNVNFVRSWKNSGRKRLRFVFVEFVWFFFAFSVIWRLNRELARMCVYVWKRTNGWNNIQAERRIKRKASSCAFICHIFLCSPIQCSYL